MKKLLLDWPIKLLTFLIVAAFIISHNAKAELYQPQSSVGTCNNLYMRNVDCSNAFGTCLPITTDCNFSSLHSEEVDDETKPIYIDTQETLCSESTTSLTVCASQETNVVPCDEDTCTDAFAALACPATYTKVMQMPVKVSCRLSKLEDCNAKFAALICPENYTKTQTEDNVSCHISKENDCGTKSASLNCEEPTYFVLDIDLGKIFCRENNGFEKKTIYSIVEDAAKKSAYEAKLAEEQGIKQAGLRRQHGLTVIDLMIYRNSLKQGLTTAQIQTMLTNLQPIKALLETGSLVTAREAIVATVADGVLVTEQDKTSLISKIDEFLNQ